MTIAANIPDELKKLNQWVCASNRNKLPMVAFANAAASSVNPDTWSTFDTAYDAVSKGVYDYCGFVFADNGYVGIDIDNAFDDYGILSPTAADIIGCCNSYTEISKSGNGIHIIIRAELPFTGKNNLNGVEIYKTARYFILTGNTLLFTQLQTDQSAVDYIVATYFPEMQRDNDNDEYAARIYNPIWAVPDNGKLRARPIYPTIPQGCRNICLTSLAGMLHTNGYTKKQIYDELMYANTVACKPQLDAREVQQICNSVTKYKR